VAAGGGVIAMAIVALAGLTGGYVAGRMARFAGWKQGSRSGCSEPWSPR